MKTTDQRFYYPVMDIKQLGSVTNKDGYQFIYTSLGNVESITCYEPNGHFSHVVDSGYLLSSKWRGVLDCCKMTCEACK